MKKYFYLLALAVLISIILLVVYFTNNQPENQLKTESVPEQNQEIKETQNLPKEEDDFSVQNFLLPDLEVEKLDEAYIVHNSGAEKILRFPGTFSNTGEGPLELLGKYDEKTDTIKASQKIYARGGADREKYVGNFIFHSTHEHWHFENFVEFELWSLKENSEFDQKIAGTGKITFCLHDYAPLPKDFQGKPENAVYPWCGDSVGVQGISVGWVDTYKADVPGQEIDVSSLPNGKYAFRAVVDSENRIVEKNEDNNSAVTYLEIRENNIQIISENAD